MIKPERKSFNLTYQINEWVIVVPKVTDIRFNDEPYDHKSRYSIDVFYMGDVNGHKIKVGNDELKAKLEWAGLLDAIDNVNEWMVKNQGICK